MLFKKSALACTCATHFSSLTHCTTSIIPCPSFNAQRPSRAPQQSHRTYATVNDDHTSSNSSSSPSDLPWPPLGNPPRPPSPYQIFNQSPSEPYSKRRFYELVKLYHPDRHKHSIDSAPPVQLLERYRLVIAANAILSDPNKKAAYDRFGQGWASEFASDSPNAAYGGGYKYGTRHRWRTDGSAAYQWPVDQDPMYNATWEDWERWYRAQINMARERARAERQGTSNARTSSSSPWAAFFTERDENERQSPVYASNYAFISIVFLLAALGGAGQATRANEQAKSRLERTREVNDQTSRVLMEARQNTREHIDAGESKGKRIQRFLKDQGDYEEGEFDARALRPGDEELCAPGLTKDRDEKRFWQKPPEDR